MTVVVVVVEKNCQFVLEMLMMESFDSESFVSEVPGFVVGNVSMMENFGNFVVVVCSDFLLGSFPVPGIGSSGAGSSEIGFEICVPQLDLDWTENLIAVVHQIGNSEIDVDCLVNFGIVVVVVFV